MAFKYSSISRARLSTCHPDLQVVFNRVLELMDNSIICGHRSKVDQDAAFAAKASKLKFPDSLHNKTPSMAVDAGPYPIDWNDSKRWYFFAGTVLAVAEELYKAGKIKHKLRWGGDWDRDYDFNDEKFLDLPHFELVKA